MGAIRLVHLTRAITGPITIHGENVTLTTCAPTLFASKVDATATKIFAIVAIACSIAERPVVSRNLKPTLVVATKRDAQSNLGWARV